MQEVLWVSDPFTKLLKEDDFVHLASLTVSCIYINQIYIFRSHRLQRIDKDICRKRRLCHVCKHK